MGPETGSNGCPIFSPARCFESQRFEVQVAIQVLLRRAPGGPVMIQVPPSWRVQEAQRLASCVPSLYVGKPVR